MMSRRLLTVVGRLLLAAALAAAAAVVPLPIWAPAVIVYIHVPLVCFVAVCVMGKLLIDTLFYPRRP